MKKTKNQHPENKTPELYYNIVQSEETPEKADIYVYGNITSWPYIESDVSAFRLANRIAQIPDSTEITLHINSYGGEVAEALAIYNICKKKKCTSVCDGFAASAASIIFAAGKTRIMNRASLLFIHQVSSFTGGNADDLEKAAAEMRTIQGAVIEAYKESGVTLDDTEIQKMLQDETWIGAEDAVKDGFATEIMDSEENDTPQESALDAINRRITGQITVQQSEDEVAEKVIDKINELIAAQKEATKPEPEPAGVGNKGFFNFKPGNGEEETNAQS